MQVTFEYNKDVPKECHNCDFYSSESQDFGRTHDVTCRLTGIGEAWCEYSHEVIRAQTAMRDACPLYKAVQ